MTRVEKRLLVLMLGVLAALFVADETGSKTAKTVVLIVFALVFLAHVQAADTSARFYGPIWLRRAQWLATGGLLLVSVVLWRIA